MINGSIPEGLTFDDVLLLPGKSAVLPAETDTRTCFTRKLALNIPLASAAMDTVTESRLAIAIARQGGIGIVHKNMPIDRQGEEDLNLKGLITVKDIQKKLEYPRAAKDEQGRLRVGAAIGATGDFLERAVEMAKYKTDVLAIDTAHGHSDRVMEAIKAIRHRLPDVQLIAGNVATYEGAKDLIAVGIDALKVRRGPGSICTTRVVTGTAVPQITSIIEALPATEGTSIPISSGGDMKYSRTM